MKESSAPVWMLVFWFVASLGWWAFAFMPTPEVSPEWLSAARNACFGTLESGLPDTYGWMLLILGPASFLIGLLVTWPVEILKGLGYFLKKPGGVFISLIILSLAIVEIDWVASKIRAGRLIQQQDFRSNIIEDLPDDYPRVHQVASDFRLYDQYGESIRLKDLQAEGKVVLLSFVFAHCQTVCPALVSQLKEAAHKLRGQNLELLFVTLDPWRDTPSSLPAIAKRWNLPENGRILSGEVEAVLKVLQDYQVPYRREAKTGNIDHPAITYLIDSNGQIVYRLNNAPPKWIEQAFARLQ